MSILQALQGLAALLQLIKELTDAASGANGSKLAETLNALRRIGESATAVAGMLTRAAQEGRSELTEDERAEIRRMDDAARQAQIAAINAVSDETGDVEARREERQERAGTSKARSGGDAFASAREGAATRKDR